jgi:gliding motility-associated-like protein
LFTTGSEGNRNWLGNTGNSADTFRASMSGLYFFTFVDANNCPASSDTVNLQFLPQPDGRINVLGTPPFCSNEGVVLRANDTSLLTYLWSNGEIASQTRVFGSGDYFLTVSDSLGCTDTGQLNILVNESPEISLAFFADTAVCCSDSIILRAQAGAGNIVWNDGVSGAERTVRDSGTYRAVLTDAQGCIDTAVSVVANYCFPDFEISSNEDTVELGQTVNLSIPISDNITFRSPIWRPIDQVSIPNQSNTSTLPLEGTTGFEVELTHRATGCRIVKIDTIYVVEESAFITPNIFTPNGDGNNDRFAPLINGTYDIIDFRIFSRWGDLVHQSPVSWDGKSLDGKDVPSGVYVYQATLSRPFRNSQQITGTVTLLR